MRVLLKYFIAFSCFIFLRCPAQKLTREQRIYNGKLTRQLVAAEMPEKLALADEILKTDSNNTRALFYKAIALYRIDKEAGYRYMKLYLKKRPTSFANKQMADFNINRGDTQAAVKNLEQALRFKNFDILVCDKMDNLFGIKKEFRSLWKLAAENNPDNFLAWTAMGIYLGKEGNLIQSYQCYQKAEKALDNELYYKYRIDYRWIHKLKAESAYKLKKYDEAIKAITTTILLYPEDPLCYKNRVKYFLAIGDRRNACRDEFQLAQVGEHYMPKAGQLYCDYKDIDNKPDSAWKNMVKAEKLFIEASKIEWGDTTVQKQRLFAYLKVTDIVPTHIYALAEEARVFSLFNALFETARLYGQVVQVDSSTHQAWYQLALCKEDLGFYKDALKDADKAVTLDSTESRYWAARAGIKTLLQDSVGAESDLTVAIKLNQTNSVAYFNRGLLFMQQHKYQPALADFLKAIDIEEDQPLSITYGKYYNNAAMAYKMLKQYDKAIEYIDIAIGTEPANPMFYFRSGEIKAMMKDMKGACEDWNMAKKLGYKDAEEVLYYNCSGEKK